MSRLRCCFCARVLLVRDTALINIPLVDLMDKALSCTRHRRCSRKWHRLEMLMVGLNIGVDTVLHVQANKGSNSPMSVDTPALGKAGVQFSERLQQVVCHTLLVSVCSIRLTWHLIAQALCLLGWMSVSVLSSLEHVVNMSLGSAARPANSDTLVSG